MKNFKIHEGDLVLGPTKHVEMVRGRSKLIQDLSLWLLEPLGTGWTTPGFGSTLWERIGGQMSEENIAEAVSEVERVLALYQQDQVQKVQQARLQGRLGLYSRTEILDVIEDVRAQVGQRVQLSGQPTTITSPDSLVIRAYLRNAKDEPINITTNVNNNE